MKLNETELKNAKELLEKGYNFLEIADKLGRSKGSVRHKMAVFQTNGTPKEERQCVECKTSFEVIKSNPKKFCDNSCAAKHNNKSGKTGRQLYKKIIQDPNCKNCRKPLINPYGKYCNTSCQHEHAKKQRWTKIEEGKIDFDARIYKSYLIEKHGNKCMRCGWNEISYYSGNVPIELEHKDGNSENNSLDNLELLS